MLEASAGVLAHQISNGAHQNVPPSFTPTTLSRGLDIPPQLRRDGGKKRGEKEDY